MSTVKFEFASPTDDVTSDENLDILIYNGTLGNEVLYETVLGADPRKSLSLGTTTITGISVVAGTYNFSAKARDEQGNLSVAFSPITVHVVSGGVSDNIIINGTTMFTATSGDTFSANGTLLKTF